MASYNGEGPGGQGGFTLAKQVKSRNSPDSLFYFFATRPNPLAFVVGRVGRFSKFLGAAVLTCTLVLTDRPALPPYPDAICVLCNPEAKMARYYALAVALSYPVGAVASQLSMTVLGL